MFIHLVYHPPGLDRRSEVGGRRASVVRRKDFPLCAGHLAIFEGKSEAHCGSSALGEHSSIVESQALAAYAVQLLFISTFKGHLSSLPADDFACCFWLVR